MKLNPHEDMTLADLGQAAWRTSEARSYAAGRLKGFSGLTLPQFRAARAFIEADYIRQIHDGKSAHVKTEAIQKVIVNHANDCIGTVSERTRQGPQEIKPIHVCNPATERFVAEAKQQRATPAGE